MNAYVIDTNVPVVANGNSPQASPACVEACLTALERVRLGIACIDDGLRIVNEYMQNLSVAGQPGAGDAFMKWVFDNQVNPEHCEIVPIHERSHDSADFHEFPNDPDLRSFDRSDRKFVAVALASKRAPTILNAVDSDWWRARVALERNGIRVDQVCGSGQFQQ